MDASTKQRDTLTRVMNKKTILRTLFGLIVVIALLSTACLILLPNTLKGMYLAMCGGILVLNLLVIIYLVNKNLKNQ